MSTLKEIAARIAEVAKADEGQARKYLASLGLTAGELLLSVDGDIGFALEDKYEAAVKALTSKLGKPTDVGPYFGTLRTKGWLFWKLGNKRYIRLTKSGLLRNKGKGSIYLSDDKDGDDE